MAAVSSSTKMLQASLRRWVLRPLAVSRTPRKILPQGPCAHGSDVTRRGWSRGPPKLKLDHPAGPEVVDLGLGEPQEAAVDLAVVLAHPGPRPRDGPRRSAAPG